MAITRSTLETILVGRTRGGLILSGISATPDADAAPRAYLADPISTAILDAGGSVSSHASPTDTDLATVADADLNNLKDLAELRVLENVLGNWQRPDANIGPLAQKHGSMFKMICDRVAQLRERAATVYGVGAPSGEVGTVSGVGVGGGLGGFSNPDAPSGFAGI